MTKKNKTGYEWYDMIPKQRISPKIKELQKIFETIPQDKDFKNQGIKDDPEMLGSIKKEQNEGNSQKEALGQIDQRYDQSKKDYTVEKYDKIRDDILKQSKRKPPIGPKIQDLQKKLQGSDAHSSLKEKSELVKSLAAKFESLSNAKESKIDTNHKVRKSGDNQSRKSFMEKLNKEMDKKNDAERSR